MTQSGSLTRDEFAVAMHLINRRLAGTEVPNTLPPSLVPPSLRTQALPASVNPHTSDTQRNLFTAPASASIPSSTQGAFAGPLPSSGQSNHSSTPFDSAFDTAPFPSGSHSRQTSVHRSSLAAFDSTFDSFGQAGATPAVHSRASHGAPPFSAHPLTPQSHSAGPSSAQPASPNLTGPAPFSQLSRTVSRASTSAPTRGSVVHGGTPGGAATPAVAPETSGVFLEAAERELTKVKEQRSKVQAKLASEEDAVAEMRTRLQAAGGEIDDEQKIVDDLTAKVTAQTTTLTELKDHLSKLALQQTHLRQEKADLLQQIEQDKAQVQQANRHVSEIQSKSATLTTDVGKLHEQLAKKKEAEAAAAAAAASAAAAEEAARKQREEEAAAVKKKRQEEASAAAAAAATAEAAAKKKREEEASAVTKIQEQEALAKQQQEAAAKSQADEAVVRGKAAQDEPAAAASGQHPAEAQKGAQSAREVSSQEAPDASALHPEVSERSTNPFNAAFPRSSAPTSSLPTGATATGALGAGAAAGVGAAAFIAHEKPMPASASGLESATQNGTLFDDAFGDPFFSTAPVQPSTGEAHNFDQPPSIPDTHQVDKSEHQQTSSVHQHEQQGPVQVPQEPSDLALQKSRILATAPDFATAAEEIEKRDPAPTTAPLPVEVQLVSDPKYASNPPEWGENKIRAQKVAASNQDDFSASTEAPPSQRGAGSDPESSEPNPHVKSLGQESSTALRAAPTSVSTNIDAGEPATEQPGGNVPRGFDNDFDLVPTVTSNEVGTKTFAAATPGLPTHGSAQSPVSTPAGSEQELQTSSEGTVLHRDLDLSHGTSAPVEETPRSELFGPEEDFGLGGQTAAPEPLTPVEAAGSSGSQPLPPTNFALDDQAKLPSTYLEESGASNQGLAPAEGRALSSTHGGDLPNSKVPVSQALQTIQPISNNVFESQPVQLNQSLFDPTSLATGAHSDDIGLTSDIVHADPAEPPMEDSLVKPAQTSASFGPQSPYLNAASANEHPEALPELSTVMKPDPSIAQPTDQPLEQGSTTSGPGLALGSGAAVGAAGVASLAALAHLSENKATPAPGQVPLPQSTELAAHGPESEGLQQLSDKPSTTQAISTQHDSAPTSKPSIQSFEPMPPEHNGTLLSASATKELSQASDGLSGTEKSVAPTSKESALAEEPVASSADPSLATGRELPIPAHDNEGALQVPDELSKVTPPAVSAPEQLTSVNEPIATSHQPLPTTELVKTPGAEESNSEPIIPPAAQGPGVPSAAVIPDVPATQQESQQPHPQASEESGVRADAAIPTVPTRTSMTAPAEQEACKDASLLYPTKSVSQQDSQQLHPQASEESGVHTDAAITNVPVSTSAVASAEQEPSKDVSLSDPDKDAVLDKHREGTDVLTHAEDQAPVIAEPQNQEQRGSPSKGAETAPNEATLTGAEPSHSPTHSHLGLGLAAAGAAGLARRISSVGSRFWGGRGSSESVPQITSVHGDAAQSNLGTSQAPVIDPAHGEAPATSKPLTGVDHLDTSGPIVSLPTGPDTSVVEQSSDRKGDTSTSRALTPDGFEDALEAPAGAPPTLGTSALSTAPATSEATPTGFTSAEPAALPEAPVPPQAPARRLPPPVPSVRRNTRSNTAASTDDVFVDAIGDESVPVEEKIDAQSSQPDKHGSTQETEITQPVSAPTEPTSLAAMVPPSGPDPKVSDVGVFSPVTQEPEVASDALPAGGKGKTLLAPNSENDATKPSEPSSEPNAPESILQETGQPSAPSALLTENPVVREVSTQEKEKTVPAFESAFDDDFAPAPVKLGAPAQETSMAPAPNAFDSTFEPHDAQPFGLPHTQEQVPAPFADKSAAQPAKNLTFESAFGDDFSPDPTQSVTDVRPPVTAGPVTSAPATTALETTVPVTTALETTAPATTAPATTAAAPVKSRRTPPPVPKSRGETVTALNSESATDPFMSGSAISASDPPETTKAAGGDATSTALDPLDAFSASFADFDRSFPTTSAPGGQASSFEDSFVNDFTFAPTFGAKVPSAGPGFNSAFGSDFDADSQKAKATAPTATTTRNTSHRVPPPPPSKSSAPAAVVSNTGAPILPPPDLDTSFHFDDSFGPSAISAAAPAPLTREPEGFTFDDSFTPSNPKPAPRREERPPTPAMDDDIPPVKRLTAMGFGRSQVINALELANYRQERALEILLGN